jgi:K+-sensing histidine kinase KdpD
LRVIKQNTLRYESFYKSLPYLNGTKTADKSAGLIESGYGSSMTSQLNKLKSLFENLFSFQQKINDFEDIKSISLELEDAVKRIIPCKEANLFLFDDDRFCPLNASASEYSINFINNIHKEGIIDWVFESKNPQIIPDLKLYNIKGSKLNYIIFPMMHNPSDKKKGMLTLLSSLASLPDESIESRMIQLIGSSVFSRIDSIKKAAELKAAYQDQQIYQSKLLNDYKLSAVGELTNGIVEEILSPLQVIMSQVDFLSKENSEIVSTEANVIKEQVKKVESIANRLIKFASINNENIKIHPCDLNKLIKDYHNLFSSTLKNINYECFLDLDDNLPPVLSHPNFIYQILTNVFSFINSSAVSDETIKPDYFMNQESPQGKKGGGILVQTRYRNKLINVRIVFTDQIKSNNEDLTQYNLRIIDNLMKKHEGEMKFLSNELNGSVVVLTFPLQRKIRL